MPVESKEGTIKKGLNYKHIFYFLSVFGLSTRRWYSLGSLVVWLLLVSNFKVLLKIISSMPVSISADIDRERLRGAIWARNLTQDECWVASLFSPVLRCPQPVPSLFLR